MKTLNPYFLNLSENPRRAALQILSDADIDTVPVDLSLLAKRLDWHLGFEDFHDPERERRDGRFEIDGNNQVSIFVNTDGLETKGEFSKDPVLRLRQRFTIAHEIGHAHLKTHSNKDLQKALEVGVSPHGRQYGYKREAQANEFASELLIPQWHLEPQLVTFSWDRFFDGIEELTQVYDVSTLACATRVASQAPVAAMCLHFNSAGKLANTPARSRDHKDTGFFFAYGERIPQRTLTDELANKSDFEGWKRKQSDSTNWFPDARKAREYGLVEQAKRVGKFGYLVFLTFEEKEQEY